MGAPRALRARWPPCIVLPIVTFGDGLPDRRRAQAGRHPHQPGVDDPGQRRQRARENRSAGRQPRRRQHRPDPGARAQCGDGRRGPRLLLQPRLLVLRLRHGRSRTTSSAATLQGGSTITQQYVKNALVGSQRSGVGGMVRKAKELVISTKMSSEWSKDQVLQSYLNIIYFGRGAYGIGAASKAYFNKPVEQLTVAEGALLAALIQRPSALDPAVNPDGAAERWNWVLDGMVDDRRAVADRPCGAGVSADGAARPGQRPEPDDGSERADRAAGQQGTARPVRHQRADAEHRGPADHHDDRPEGAGGRRGSGDRDTRRPGAGHAGRGGVDRPEDRRRQGVLRRIRRQGLRLRSGRVADRVVVQGVRVGRRAAAGHRPGLPGGQLARRGQRHQDHQRRGRAAAAPATSPRR